MFLTTVRAAGLSPSELGPRVREAIDTSKVVHVADVEAEDLRRFYNELCDALGGSFLSGEASDSGQPTGERWICIGFDPAFPMRYRHAPVAQMLHTDYAYTQDNPPLALIYCENQAQAGGQTTFLDAEEVARSLQERDPGLLAELFERDVRFSKAGREKVDRVLRAVDGETQLTWLHTCVDAGNDEPTRAMADRFAAYVAEHLEDSPGVHEVRMQPGEAVIWWDERVLHGRRSYVAQRRHERLLWKTGIDLGRA